MTLLKLDRNDEVLIAGFGRKGKAKGDYLNRKCSFE